MKFNILYPDNLEIRLELEKAWNLAASDRLTWYELEQLAEWVTKKVEEFEKLYNEDIHSS